MIKTNSNAQAIALIKQKIEKLSKPKESQQSLSDQKDIMDFVDTIFFQERKASPKHVN